jgi:hypothetical protein
MDNKKALGIPRGRISDMARVVLYMGHPPILMRGSHQVSHDHCKFGGVPHFWTTPDQHTQNKYSWLTSGFSWTQFGDGLEMTQITSTLALLLQQNELKQSLLYEVGSIAFM